jgi:glycosyltransferase involved in cell wall biosynthesis
MERPGRVSQRTVHDRMSRCVARFPSGRPSADSMHIRSNILQRAAMKPEITIVLATYNGERTLPRTLASLGELEAPPCSWNIVVVDNGSTDRTAEILHGFIGKLPITILQEAARGKNRALNRALREPLGDLVVFTDDDIVADPSWLRELHGCAARQPQADIFGGTILPAWEMPPADWILKSIPDSIAFGISDPTWSEGPISPGFIWGANMMVRRRVFDGGQRFNDQVGPNKGLYIMGSETEFTHRIAEMGFLPWYCPQARVCHIIRASQLNREWIMKRAIRFGRLERYRAVKIGLEGTRQTFLFGWLNFPRWVLLDFARCYLKGHLLRFLGGGGNWAGNLWQAHLRLGYIIQAQSERNANPPS